MSLGGISDYLRANNISIPQHSSAGTYLPYANQGPYEDIMARMRASGGRGGSGGVYGGGGGTGAPVVGATGGYDPNLYRRAAAAAAPVAGAGMMDEILSRGGRGSSLEADDIKKSQDAWTNLSDAQKANYYANNPTMAGITQTLGKLFGLSSVGMLQKYLYPEFVENQGLIARGITPNATSEINTGNTVQDPMQRQELARQLGLLQTPETDTSIPRYDLNVGSGFTTVVAAPEAAVATPVTYSPITTTDLSDNYSNEGRQQLARQLGLLQTPETDTSIPGQTLAQINAQRDAETLAFRELLDAQQAKMDRESGYTEKKAEKERLAKLDSYYTGVTDSGGFAPVATPVAADAQQGLPGVTFTTDSRDFSTQYGLDREGPGESAGNTLNRQLTQAAAAPVVAAPAPVAAPPPAPAPTYYSGGFEDDGGRVGQMLRDAALAAGGGGGGSYTGGYQTSGEFKGMPSIYGGIGATPYAKGGPVSMNRLQGPNPAGPDDGYATLKSGEFVITDKAVKKYGIELMNAINSGKISKGKLRGLLEM